jgi:hypothetical protein
MKSLEHKVCHICRIVITYLHHSVSTSSLNGSPSVLVLGYSYSEYACDAIFVSVIN